MPLGFREESEQDIKEVVKPSVVITHGKNSLNTKKGITLTWNDDNNTPSVLSTYYLSSTYTDFDTHKA